MRNQRPGERTRTQAGADVDARRRAVLHGTSRSHVLETLRAADAPLSVTEVAGRVGLHPNTIRWHLDQLAGAGWVTHAAEPRAGQGRPRVACAAGGDAFPACDEEGSGRGYRLLADILASSLADATPDPATAAGDAGRAWGRYLTDKPAPLARLSPAQATSPVVGLLDDLGLAPEAAEEVSTRD